MKVKTLGSMYIWEGGYNTRNLPKLAGFKWDSVNRRWWTADKEIARRLFKYADFKARCDMGAPRTSDIEPAHVGLVLVGLKMLASACDYAKDLDGQGFGKSDAYAGHELAAKEALTVEQAELGLKLLRLHQHQLPEWLVSPLSPYFKGGLN